MKSHQVVIGDRGLKEGQLEYKARRDDAKQQVPREDVLAFIEAQLAKNQR